MLEADPWLAMVAMTVKGCGLAAIWGADGAAMHTSSIESPLPYASKPFPCH